jgi:predicted transcriptional regulator
MADQSANPNHLELTAEIVSAYVSNNSLPQSELSAMLRAVHDALNRAAAGRVVEPAPALAPPVPIRKSVTPDYIVCLEDGKKFRPPLGPRR